MKCPARDILARRPERLVVSGYRNMMAAFDLADASCWDAVWNQYTSELGIDGARRTVGDLQHWARSIRASAVKPLSFFPTGCVQLCHDECMALSMMAAGQAEDAEAGLLAAEFVTGVKDRVELQEVWRAARHFAAALQAAGQVMYPVPCAVIRTIHMMQQAIQPPASPTLN